MVTSVVSLRNPFILPVLLGPSPRYYLPPGYQIWTSRPYSLALLATRLPFMFRARGFASPPLDGFAPARETTK